MRRRPFGPTVSVPHFCVLPSACFTSNQNHACGFCQSTLVSTPVITTDFVTSNCAFTAWCASAVETRPTARPTPASAAIAVLLRINPLPPDTAARPADRGHFAWVRAALGELLADRTGAVRCAGRALA